MNDTRIECDSMGELEVPAGALYGAQTQRAVNNFPVSGQPMPTDFIRAVARIKAAAAEVNAALGLLDQRRAKAITT
ncbi:MAG: aspartate ammonia-lyase, partial [Billgrantia desiderata]